MSSGGITLTALFLYVYLFCLFSGQLQHTRGINLCFIARISYCLRHWDTKQHYFRGSKFKIDLSLCGPLDSTCKFWDRWYCEKFEWTNVWVKCVDIMSLILFLFLKSISSHRWRFFHSFGYCRGSALTKETHSRGQRHDHNRLNTEPGVSSSSSSFCFPL